MSSPNRLRDLVERLRADCPWDKAQTAETMRPYLLEEAYEVLDALDHADPARLQDELGDLLFQVYFHARLAEEKGEFDIAGVVDGIHAKMVERHPHVFGGGGDPSIGGWEARKAAKRGGGSRVDGVPQALPALVRAHRVGEKVGAVGFDWPDREGVLTKIDEEIAELREAILSGDTNAIAHEYGDVLLALSSLGRHLGIAGEDALRLANLRFETRFRDVEHRASIAGISLENAGPALLDAWWNQAKRT